MKILNKKTGKKLNTAHHGSPDINLSKVSERCYQDLFNNASDAIFIRDLKGNITEVNEAAVTLTGYTHNELIGMNVSEFLTAESFKATMKKQKALLEDETATQRYELEIVRKDGVRLSAESRTSLLTHNGQPLGIQCIVRDITERKRAEEALKESEEKFRTFMETASDLMHIADKDGNITYVNESMARTLGYSKEEMIGKHVTQFLAPDQVAGTLEEVFKRRWKELITKGEIAIDCTWVAKDRKKVYGELKVVSIYDSEGKYSGSRAVFRDLTERKRAEEALRFLSSVLEQAKDSVIVTNHSYEIEYVNKATEELYGYSREELVGLTPLILNAEPMAEDIQRDIYKTVSSGGVVTEAVLNKRKDGSTFVCDFKVSSLSDKDGRVLGYIGIQRDITEQRRMEEALQESEERYRTVADFTYDWEYWLGPDRDLRYISPSCERMTGYRVDEFLRDPKLLDRIIHPDDYPVIAQHINEEFKSKEVHHADFRITSRSGEERWIAHWCQPVYGNDGSWLGRRGSNRDITQRKRVEEALQASEEGFRNIYEESPIGIELYDCDGRLLTANRACLDIFGVSNIAEVQGFKLFEDPNVTDEIKQRLRKGETVRYEAPFDFERVKERKLYNTSKSETIYLNASITPLGVRGEKGLGSYLVQVQDVTERKWAEEALRESERNFRNSLDDSPLGIRIVTAEGELLYANQAILDIYGYSSIEELRTTPTKQRYTPKSYAEYQNRKERRKQGKPVPAEYEISIVRKDGEIRHLAVFRKVVVWGGEIQFQTLYQDITEHKRVEMALRQSEEFNSGLLANSPSPILVLNADASIKYANPALEKLTGFSSAELIGSKPPYPWWIEETRKELSRRLVQAIHWGARKHESLYRKKNGERFWVEKISKTVRVNGEFKYYLVNWVDLTERKRLKANMEFYLSKITKAQEEERKRIAREIHDESIQSLATLALGIDAIVKEKERLPKDVIRRLKGLRAETNSVLDGLRRFSHELRPGVIDQVGLVPALEILTEELNKENNVKASLVVVGSERRPIPETELALFRIAQEALHNIKRHSRATQCVIRLKFTREKVQLTVSDNGRGFEAPDTLSDLATEHKLGLIGIQERTRLLNGKLFVRSRLGRGTTVVVQAADTQGMKG